MDPSAKKKANFFRVCQLLVDKGGDALKVVLHAIHPSSTLAAVLYGKKSVLQNIRVITDSQWDLLFPPSGVPDSEKFDITLLTILLRNIFVDYLNHHKDGTKCLQLQMYPHLLML